MVAKEAAVVLEEVVEDGADILEDRASWLISNPKAVILTVGVVSVLSGALVSYLVVNSRLRAKYQKLADEQIEDVKNHYLVFQKDKGDLAELAAKYPDTERTATPEEVAEAESIIDREGYIPYDKIKTQVTPPATPVDMIHSAEKIVQEASAVSEEIVRNIWESDDPDTYFDFEEELQRREDRPEFPFVITKEEFDQAEADYQQGSLTYFDGDNILIDDTDKPCDLDFTIGAENVLRFGHGSGDKNIVYIRNPKLELDFEVTQSLGTFTKEVLGYDGGESELKHAHRRPQRMRASDE